MTNKDYLYFQQTESFSWMCPPCWAQELPFHDCSVLDSSSIVDDSLLSCASDVARCNFPPKTGTLRLAHLNCRSLLSHKDDVLAMFFDAQLDVLALTETWLDETIVDSEITSYGTGLILVRTDRNRCGGGVAFVISNSIPFVLKPELREGNVESLWIERFPKSKRSLLVYCVYRPPSKADVYDNFTSECENVFAVLIKKCLLLEI